VVKRDTISLYNSGGTAEASFVPDVDEGFFVLSDRRPYFQMVKIRKEAQMKKRIRINYIFWKEGPLLPRLLKESKI
jgi:hypothetical protein